MKKIIIIILTIFLLTQNNDYNELNDLAIVNSIIINYQNNNYEIYLQTQNYKDNKNYLIYNTTSNSINKLFTNISTKSPNKLYYKHLNTLLLTENSIHHLNSIFNYFINNNITRNEFYIFIIPNNNTNKYINIESSDIINLIKTNKYKEPTFDNILNNYLNNEEKLIIPKIENNNNSISLSKIEGVKTWIKLIHYNYLQ